MEEMHVPQSQNNDVIEYEDLLYLQSISKFNAKPYY